MWSLSLCVHYSAPLCTSASFLWCRGCVELLLDSTRRQNSAMTEIVDLNVATIIDGRDCLNLSFCHYEDFVYAEKRRQIAIWGQWRALSDAIFGSRFSCR
jgi:hypothetical protein